MAMLAVVKAHQSRARMRNKLLPKEIRGLPADGWLALILPGFFRDDDDTNPWLILTAETCGSRQCHKWRDSCRADFVGGYPRLFQTRFPHQTQFVGSTIRSAVRTESVLPQHI